MFEFHGWIALGFSDLNAGEYSDETTQPILDIKSLIDAHKDSSTKFDIFYQQGKPFVRIDGCVRSYQAWVLKLFYDIAKTADDSDGILFRKDDENSLFDNQYRVWQMSAGEVLSGEITFFPDVSLDLFDPSD